MRLRQLFEEKIQEVAIIFGRFNPPHKGHKEAWLTAANKKVWYVGTNEGTIGPNDPLPFEVKVEAMKTILPEVKEHLIPEQDWFTLATYVYETHGKVALICVTDEAWVVPALQKSNGRADRHGFYDFPLIRLYHDSIEEAKLELRKSSATSLREAVKLGDRQKFSDAAGVSSETPVMGKPFFDLVAEYLLRYSDKDKGKNKKETNKKDSKKTKKDLETKKDKKDEKDQKKDKETMDLATLRAAAKNAKPVNDMNKEITEFVSAGNDKPPRGPKNKGRDPWDDDDSGEDPYGRPEPEYYSRSIKFFGKFEADHFDDEEFDEETGVFKGYWDDEEGRVQIAYFKFDDPEQAAKDFDGSPGMGWYYEPQ